MRNLNAARPWHALVPRGLSLLVSLALLACGSGAGDLNADGGKSPAPKPPSAPPAKPPAAPPAPPAPPKGGGNDDGSGGGGGGAGGEKKTAPPFTVVSGKKSIEVTEATLAQVPSARAPVGDQQTLGWELSAILTSNNIPPKGRATLYDADGVRVEIAAADWNGDNTRLFLKRNNKGQWRFRMYKKVGEGWNPTSELRGMTRIVMR